MTNPDDSPAKDIDVEALHKDEKVLGKTHDNGIAKMTINTKAEDSELSIVASSKPKVLQAAIQLCVHVCFGFLFCINNSVDAL